MDGDLYDEFGNYIGPELESDESEGEEEKYGAEEEEVNDNLWEIGRDIRYWCQNKINDVLRISEVRGVQ